MRVTVYTRIYFFFNLKPIDNKLTYNFFFHRLNMTKASGGASEYDFIFKLVLIGDSSVGKV